MLSEEENLVLTRVGPGSPMGDLLRRYWFPIAAQAELDDHPVKQVRLLGEDLALYKDRGGRYGLVDLFCPHRRASMAFGVVEDCGLRCVYHGWLFDRDGACLEQPFEETIRPDSTFKEKTRIKAYEVQAKAGLLWAYLGPKPAPCLWDWDVFHQRGYKLVSFARLDCNWFQCNENNIDPVHFEWLHRNWDIRLRGKTGPYAPKHVKIAFDEFDHGFVYRRLLEGMADDDGLWKIGRVCLWPNCLYVGNFSWSVPIDDEHTLRVAWELHPLPGDRPFEQSRIPYWYAPLEDASGRVITMGEHQDFIALVSQGTIADRTKERLGESDRGVIMMRRRFLSDLEVVASGGDPKNVLRDDAANHRLPLPTVRTPRAIRAAPQMAGRPETVADEMRRLFAEHSRPA